MFTVGGDANIDGLVTFASAFCTKFLCTVQHIIADILAMFNPKLEGISHGMGTADALPPSQFNVAASGAESDGMPAQVSFDCEEKSD